MEMECFIEMKRSNVEYDNVNAKDLDLGEQIHGVAIKSRFDLDISCK